MSTYHINCHINLQIFQVKLIIFITFSYPNYFLRLVTIYICKEKYQRYKFFYKNPIIFIPQFVCFIGISNSFVTGRKSCFWASKSLRQQLASCMIFIVVLIVKLRECRSNSSSGSNASDGGGSIINSQFSTIQLPALNTDDASVIASDF